MALVLAVGLTGCGGNGDGRPSPNSIEGQWAWTITSFDCAVFDGILIDPQNFAMNQNGTAVNATFTDSNTNQVEIDGEYLDSYFRGTVRVTTPASRVVLASFVLRAWMENDQVTIDGDIRLQADSQGICDTGNATVWMNKTSPSSPEEVFTQCGPVDIVFLMDTSGSMDDEADALCTQIDTVLAQLDSFGLTDVRVFKWGINEDADAEEHVEEGNFECLENNPRDIFNDPIVPGTQDRRLNLGESDEDWGPGTSIVSYYGTGGRSQNFQWRANAIRILIPISDEGPDQGSPANEPEDAASIQAAIGHAKDARVIVSPIIGTGAEPGVSEHARALAEGTGGRAFRSVDPSLDFGQLIYDIVFEACGGTLPNPIPPLNLGSTVLIATTRDGAIYRIDPDDAGTAQVAQVRVTSPGVQAAIPIFSSLVYNEGTERLWGGTGGRSECEACIYDIDPSGLASSLADNSDEAYAHPGLAQRRSDGVIFGMPGDGDSDLLFVNPSSGVAVEYAEDIDDYADAGDFDPEGNGITFVGQDPYLVARTTLWKLDDFSGRPNFVAELTPAGFPENLVDNAETGFEAQIISMTTRPSDKKVFGILRLTPLRIEQQQQDGRFYVLVSINVDTGVTTYIGTLDHALDGLAWIPENYWIPD